MLHNDQKEKWNEEHKNPFSLKQMDNTKPSSGVVLFSEFLKSLSKKLEGLEMGCGKGRNVIWLAKQDYISKMHGFDFSDIAINEAVNRSINDNISNKTEFKVMDATVPWEYKNESFDFLIDCTASTDIESAEGRAFAAQEIYRVLKQGGYLLVYVMSDEDEYHAMMIKESPAHEKGAFLHPATGKFEKVFTSEELDSIYSKFNLVEEKRIKKSAEFFGKSYNCKNHFRIYKK